jgi:tetratricopeptide (TPR) repeat protein
MAELYKSLGAFEMASLQWERILEIDPFNAKARERLDSLEISLLTVKADNMHSRTMELLETLGPESARTVYTQTIKLYERILSMNPDDKIRNAMEELKRRFQDKTEPSAPRKPLTIVRTEVDNLFPSLMQYYRDHPVGTVTVKNTLEETAEHLKAAFRIKKYMDFPAVTDWEGTLAPGKEARFDLKVIFNDSIFALQEDLPVQAEITVSYQVGGVDYKVRKAVPLTIYRRTALTWEDTGKIASFIMPNEGIVNRFSHKVAFTEIKICDALGMYDVHYIEDPESPISGILGKTGAIDTVRFPRTTLLIQSGDCDDTTVLLASLLESSGVKTAVMTSPGHVFMAMDTGEPEGNRWLFTTDRLEVISHEGRVWLPVETTLLKEGFLAAWTHASGLVKRYSGSIEFLPVDALRDTYPSLPLPESSFTIVEPPADRLKSRFLASVESVSNELYSSNLAGLKSQLSRASGKQSLKLRNQIAVLHARFGEDREAEKEFKRIIRSDPDFLSSYLNLANLNLSRKETDKAISVLKEGLKIKPDTVLLNLLIARAYLLKNKQDMALKHYRIVQERSPGIAEKYAALFIQPGADRDVQRASAADDELPFIWDSGE